MSKFNKLLNFIKVKINNIKIKFRYNDIKIGLVKGFSLPLLPRNVENILNKPIIRILRVIGGFCAVLVITGKYKLLPSEMHIPLIIMGLLQLIQINIVSIIKIIYGLKRLIKHPEDFEVRNSP